MRAELKYQRHYFLRHPRLITVFPSTNYIFLRHNRMAANHGLKDSMGNHPFKPLFPLHPPLARGSYACRGSAPWGLKRERGGVLVKSRLAARRLEFPNRVSIELLRAVFLAAFMEAYFSWHMYSAARARTLGCSSLSVGTLSLRPRRKAGFLECRQGTHMIYPYAGDKRASTVSTCLFHRKQPSSTPLIATKKNVLNADGLFRPRLRFTLLIDCMMPKS